MIATFLYYFHYILLLCFGIILTMSFAGIRYTKKMWITSLSLFAICGFFQFFIFWKCGENTVWKVYPLITHFPTLIALCLFFRKRFLTALASVTSAYLCCQPAKWSGLLFLNLTGDTTIETSVRIIMLLLCGLVIVLQFSPYISQLYNKDNRSILIFISVPLVYYLFDYIMILNIDFWIAYNRIASEFLPCFLCVAFLLFCLVYYKEYEQKTDAERNAHINRITAQQYANEIKAIRQSELSIRLLRHDMRLLLNNLAFSIEQDDKEYALKMISGYVSSIDATMLHRYCANDTINYVLTHYESKCKNMEISFSATVNIEDLHIDEIMFSSILSNALDNATNAQTNLSAHRRFIKVMLKSSGEKLLLSVKNPYSDTPLLIDGVPISRNPWQDHGYGTQSIRYMTERLGGNCQFILEDDQFVVRVII